MTLIISSAVDDLYEVKKTQNYFADGACDPLSPRERVRVRGKSMLAGKSALALSMDIPFPLIPTFSLGEKEMSFPAFVPFVNRWVAKTEMISSHQLSTLNQRYGTDD